MQRGLTLLWCRYLAWAALRLLGCGHGDELAKLQAMRGTLERDVASMQGRVRACVDAQVMDRESSPN